jgi:hypothetical protein
MKKIWTLIVTVCAMVVLAPIASACEKHHSHKTTQTQQEEVKVEEVEANSAAK